MNWVKLTEGQFQLDLFPVVKVSTSLQNSRFTTICKLSSIFTGIRGFPKSTFCFASNLYLQNYIISGQCNNWVKAFKNGPGKICGRQPLKNLKGCGLLKQTISLQFL